MGSAYFNEYEARAYYYNAWLKEQIGEEGFPEDQVGLQRLF